MDSKEIKTLEHFLTRTGMWVYPINESTIVSFIHGFEAGINNKTFTLELKEYLESENNIYGLNQGWPRQVLLFSEKRKISWHEAFIEAGKETIEKIKRDCSS